MMTLFGNNSIIYLIATQCPTLSFGKTVIILTLQSLYLRKTLKLKKTHLYFYFYLSFLYGDNPY